MITAAIIRLFPTHFTGSVDFVALRLVALITHRFAGWTLHLPLGYLYVLVLPARLRLLYIRWIAVGFTALPSTLLPLPVCYRYRFTVLLVYGLRSVGFPVAVTLRLGCRSFLRSGCVHARLRLRLRAHYAFTDFTFAVPVTPRWLRLHTVAHVCRVLRSFLLITTLPFQYVYVVYVTAFTTFTFTHAFTTFTVCCSTFTVYTTRCLRLHTHVTRLPHLPFTYVRLPFCV